MSLGEAALRFRHGFSQLVMAFQAVRHDRFAWRRYLVVASLQGLVTVAVAGVFVAITVGSSEQRREVRVRRALEQVSAAGPGTAAGKLRELRLSAHPERPAKGERPAAPAAAPAPERAPAPTRAAPPAEEQEDPDEESTDEDDDDETPAPAARQSGPSIERDGSQTGATSLAELQKRASELEAAIAELAKQAGPTSVRRDEDFQVARKALDRQLVSLQKDGQKLPLTAEDKAALVRLGAQLDVLEEKTKPGWLDSALALALSIYGTLSLVQAGVIALSRDYHAAIARDASLLLGVAPEDPPLWPRVRINVGWIRRKLKQRTRSLMVFLPGAGLIGLVTLPFPGRTVLTTVLTSAWAAYWWVVWTASKSARAWEHEKTARPPWFLRGWHRLSGRVPVLGAIARTWERLWTRLTRSVFSPAEAVEAQPAEFAGLAAARALQLIPVLKLFVRPLVPVAAARLMAERITRAELLPGSAADAWTRAAASVPASPDALRARDDV